MTIFENIKNDLTKSRKEQKKDDVIILSTIMGAMQNVAHVNENGEKEVNDVSAIKYLRSHFKNLEEMIKHDPSQKNLYERNLVLEYLPPLMLPEDILNVIKNNDFKAMKDFMSFMVKNYPMMYDGGTASKLFQEHSSISKK